MSKPQKFKGKQGTFNVTFEGIDLVIPNVMVKEVDRGEGSNWATLDENKGRWKLLTTPGYLIDVDDAEPQSIAFDRTDPAHPQLVDAFNDTWTIAIHTALHLGPEKKIYSIDECDVGMRLQHTDAVIPNNQHDLITRIIFEKVSK